MGNGSSLQPLFSPNRRMTLTVRGTGLPFPDYTWEYVDAASGRWHSATAAGGPLFGAEQVTEFESGSDLRGHVHYIRYGPADASMHHGLQLRAVARRGSVTSASDVFSIRIAGAVAQRRCSCTASLSCLTAPRICRRAACNLAVLGPGG